MTKKYKSIRYRRPPPSHQEVIDWCKENWNVLQYWENVYILNPETKGSNPSWDQFNCKLADLVIETPGCLNIGETDPTILMQSFAQALVYKWYMSNKEYIGSLRDRKLPSSKQIFFHPDTIPPLKNVKAWIFVRETDSMIERVCRDYGINVVEIPV